MNTVNHRQGRLIEKGLYAVLFTTLMLSSGAAYTEIYKWVDDSGNVHYTQTPPPAGITASTIAPPPPVATDQARQRLEARLDSLERRADNRQEQSQQEQESNRESAGQQRLCQQARDRLASYERPRVSVPGADGTPRRLDESERQEELQHSRKLVQDLCR